ncbi:TolC family protein [Paludibacterium sp.]|uniref:TolC family protein n=1 Tax=Paludibacterium sp. TaxID=1917523 RepID=UPI0025D4C61F|nr:TolC family protein [Paludibacterium sp.]MBV8649429.1 TolC family protein [Paludibacterium sp.]
MKTPSAILLMASGVLSLTLQAQAAPLSLQDMTTLAVARAPQVRALQMGSQAQTEEAHASGEWPDPKIKIGEEKLPVSDFRATDQTMDVIGVAQMIPGGNKLPLAVAASRLNAEKMQADASLTRLSIRRDAALAWLDAVYARAQIRLLAQQLHTQERQAQAQRLALAHGQGSLAGAAAADRARLLLADRIAQVQTDQRKADAQVVRWVGLADLPDTLPELDAPPPLAELDERLERHPAILVRGKETDLATNALQQAREAKVPDWEFELSYGRARTPGMPNTLTAMVSFNLPIRPGARQDRLAAARNLDLEAAAATRDAELQSLRAELAADYADWLGLDGRLNQLATTLPQRAGHLLASNIAGYANGSATFDQVSDARQSAIDDALKLLELRYQRDRARLALDYFVPADR